jgi:hypothetical protein
MTIAVAIIVGLIGMIAIVFGLIYFFFFKIGSALFEKTLQTDAAKYGQDQVAHAVRSISNKFLGRELADTIIATGGTAALALTRNILKSRMRTGVLVATGGLMVFVASFFTGSWLPMIWRSA